MREPNPKKTKVQEKEEQMKQSRNALAGAGMILLAGLLLLSGCGGGD